MIPNNFHEAFTEIQKLVANFQTNPEYYLSSKYQESEVRQHFLDKFFQAFGWDIYHEEQTNPYEREVRIEKAFKKDNFRGKRADYAFFISPDFKQTRFIVEAKKPAVNLENPDACFQTIRYGWNSQTPIAVLTDFDRFFILDSRYKPNIETAADRIYKKYHHTDFVDEEKLRELYFLFSRDAVANDSIERFAAEMPKARGARKTRLFRSHQIEPIDEEFLRDLDDQRESLAKAFKKSDSTLDSESLTEITQRTLDRLVFIRFLEDKLVETGEIINGFGSRGGSPWRDFVGESARLNKIYNGIIFKPHDILDSTTFTPDEKAFEEVRDDLSNLNSPYDFNTIPIHILGSIYERFLGKTIVATDKRVKIEEKPEVRKAGGVYYTPEYIVRYIVENTIGTLIEGKKPEEIAKMRFADIACGSGSFLLGVFDYLIAYHVRYFDKFKKNRKEAIENKQARETAEGTLQLTLSFKREILLNNIYGVDLDMQAVEVAQLSLYLKLLEEETTSTAQQYLTGFREQMLPSLNKNIVHGNSLISYRNYSMFAALDSNIAKDLNLMDFEQSFPKIFSNNDKSKCGFDAIVGNPPYVRQELLGDFKHYFKKYYETYHGVADLYVYFFEQYIKLLKDGGEFGIIVANKWLRANYGEPLRRWLKQYEIEEIVDFGDLPVFQGATTYPCVVIVRKSDKETESFDSVQIESLDFGNRTLTEIVEADKFEVKKEYLKDKGWSLSSKDKQELLDKLSKIGVPLGEYVDGKIYRGILTGLNEAFVIDAETRDRLIAENASSAELIKPFLAGRDIKRYETPTAEKFLILIPKYWTKENIRKENSSNKFSANTALDWLKTNYPAIVNHLQPFAQRAEKRYDKGEYWWELRGCDYYDEFEKPKLIYPNICKQPEFVFSETIDYTNQKCFIISIDDKYLLAILNSKVSFFLFRQLLPKLRGDFYEPSYVYFKDFPIRTIDFDKPLDKERHDKIVGLVEQMLDAKKKLNDANTDKDKQFYQRFCSSLDTQIDNLVYDLYELTDEERAIVEVV